jgi:hypothetical protein
LPHKIKLPDPRPFSPGLVRFAIGMAGGAAGADILYITLQMFLFHLRFIVAPVTGVRIGAGWMARGTFTIRPLMILRE